MKEKPKKALFIFRRDLRLYDNTALIKAFKESESVLPCFIFDQRQVEKNEYKSENALQFLIESLEELGEEIKEKKGKLYVFYGIAEEVVEKLISMEKIDAVYLNNDYTPFSKKRDASIEKICKKYSIEFNGFEDALLTTPGKIFNKSDRPYTVYTPFFKYVSTLPVSKPQTNKLGEFYKKKIDFEIKGGLWKFLEKKNNNLAMHGGRKNALGIFDSIKDFKGYDSERDFPSLNATTHLSPHLKFGTVSPREVYYLVKESFSASHTLIRELYWRDFFYHIGSLFPHVFESSFYKKYDSLKWAKNDNKFKQWCEGKTGFPIVDAGMRELNETGYMHNRVRMIVSSFLVKDMHISWKWGERYFASKLVDYDPCINNGNWQWAASTGCDAQPYFRIFNPWLQQKKFDVNCEYIKKWVPELESFSPNEIHNIFKTPLTISGYSAPILAHDVESKRAKDLYKKALEVNE